MPLYHAHCHTCGAHKDYYSRIANRHVTPVCCSAPMEKQLDAPMVSAMIWTGHAGMHMPDGANGGKGTFIESGQDYKRYLKEKNVIPESEGASEAAHQQKQRAANDDRKLTEAVEKAVYSHISA